MVVGNLRAESVMLPRLGFDKLGLIASFFLALSLAHLDWNARAISDQLGPWIYPMIGVINACGLLVAIWICGID